MSIVDRVSTGSWMLCVVTIARNLLLPLVLFFPFYSFPFPFLLFYKTLFPPYFLLHTITPFSLLLFYYEQMLQQFLLLTHRWLPLWTSLSLYVTHSVVSDSLQPRGLLPTSLLCPWDFSGQNNGVGCHFLLRGSCSSRDQTWVSCIGRRILYHLSHQRSPNNTKPLFFPKSTEFLTHGYCDQFFPLILPHGYSETSLRFMFCLLGCHSCLVIFLDSKSGCLTGAHAHAAALVSSSPAAPRARSPDL